MSVSDKALRDFSRAHPGLLAVRRSDWQALSSDQRQALKAGLSDVRVGSPAVWTVDGPWDSMHDPRPDAADILFVSADHRLGERTILSIMEAVRAPTWRVEKNASGAVTASDVWKRAMRDSVETKVDAEIAARHPVK